MPSVPNKVADRLISGIKQFQPILAAAKARDAGEADTVTIVKDMLQDVFGYNKYVDVTSEHAIKGTYCDLAIKLDNNLQTLIEVKSIGLELKDLHVKQAIDYAANQGVMGLLADIDNARLAGEIGRRGLQEHRDREIRVRRA
jgi:hypothetical protein